MRSQQMTLLAAGRTSVPRSKGGVGLGISLHDRGIALTMEETYVCVRAGRNRVGREGLKSQQRLETTNRLSEGTEVAHTSRNGEGAVRGTRR